MSFDDPTQRIRRTQPVTRMPRPLDLTEPGDAGSDDTTNVLRLDELFDDQPPTDTTPPAAAAPTSTAEAPTWTAMPVVPVRSGTIPTGGNATPSSRPRQNDLYVRIRRDAGAALTGAGTRTRDWFAQQDNALMAATALVAIVLIIVVAALGH